ncbi:hypothetical protein K438DRAFT_1965653 [Mycena galopus ATCC 62051]|nr:hypothetical protein K438DRAFT_1965653 [Mycena galopus ATCC 62051]
MCAEGIWVRWQLSLLLRLLVLLVAMELLVLAALVELVRGFVIREAGVVERLRGGDALSGIADQQPVQKIACLLLMLQHEFQQMHTENPQNTHWFILSLRGWLRKRLMPSHPSSEDVSGTGMSRRINIWPNAHAIAPLGLYHRVTTQLVLLALPAAAVRVVAWVERAYQAKVGDEQRPEVAHEQGTSRPSADLSGRPGRLPRVHVGFAGSHR